MFPLSLYNGKGGDNIVAGSEAGSGMTEYRTCYIKINIDIGK